MASTKLFWNAEIATSKARDLELKELKEIYQAVLKELDVIVAILEDTDIEEALLQARLLNHTAEIKKQLALATEISRTLFNIERIKAFQEVVLEEHVAVDPQVRSKIVRRLAEKLSGALRMNINQGVNHEQEKD
jgi:hypothetical protein